MLYREDMGEAGKREVNAHIRCLCVLIRICHVSPCSRRVLAMLASCALVAHLSQGRWMVSLAKRALPEASVPLDHPLLCHVHRVLSVQPRAVAMSVIVQRVLPASFAPQSAS